MYKLTNSYGTVTVTVSSECDRDRLIRSGYKLCEKSTDLDTMTVPQLEAYAKEKGIDLTGCSNKAEKLAKIKEAEGCQ